VKVRFADCVLDANARRVCRGITLHDVADHSAVSGRVIRLSGACRIGFCTVRQCHSGRGAIWSRPFHARGRRPLKIQRRFR
jgi:hypothetical protein